MQVNAQVNLLKIVVSAVAGQQASGIVDILYDKKNVNEFLIAKKLKLTINQTRNLLYKLSDEGIVSFIRKKDKKKGGWYIYFWTLNIGKGLLKLKEHILKNIGNIGSRLNLKKTERFYHCENCSIESNEENALLYQYTCPECGEVLHVKDKGKEIEHLEKEIAKLEDLLKSVEYELGIVGKKEGVVKARKVRAEAKKKSKEREIKKKSKARALKKLEKLKLKKKKSRKIKRSRKSVKKIKKSKKFAKKIKRFFGR